MLALFPGFVVPVLAVSCPDNGTLTQGNVSPSSGTTNTNFHFTVVYQDDAGDTPSLIQVTFDGANGRRLFPEIRRPPLWEDLRPDPHPARRHVDDHLRRGPWN